MSEQSPPSMAPDSHTDSAGPAQLIAGITLSPATGSQAPHQLAERCTTTTRPLPNGILFKGKKSKKRVSFRDSDLVKIREIPPRSSSGDEESEEDDDAGSSDSDEETDSDSEEEDVPAQQAPVVVNGSEKTVTVSVSRASPSPPVSTLTVRPERAPILWTPVSSFTGPKAACNAPVSPASKVASLVSQITGVSASASQTHVRQRSAVVATSSPSPSPSPVRRPPSPSPVHKPPSPSPAHKLPSPSPAHKPPSPSPAHKPPSPVPPKKAPTVVRVEKKVKKITSTLDNVMTSQTVRSVQKHGAVTEALHKGNNVKTGKKKRVLQRRQEGNDKRKTTPSRKTKDSKQQSSNTKAQESSAPRQTVNAKRNVSSAGARPKVIMNGFGPVRDSLSLPPLSSDDSVLLNPAKLLQQRPLPKTSVYSVDGFIFPGDPTHDLAAGLRASAAASGAEDVKLKPQGPPTTLIPGYPLRDAIPGQRDLMAGNPVRDRASSAPPGSASRRKRFYAWKMANGNLQSSLHEPPSITPMWETVTPVPALTPKPAYVADR